MLLYTPDQGERTIGLGGLIEGQYQLMFNHNWGLAIGVQVSTLRSSANYNYSYAIPNVTLPGANYPADLDIHFYNWRERQSATLLSIPLQLVFRAPISVGSAFQRELGASLNHPLQASYKTIGGRYVTTAYMPQTNVTYTDMENHGLGTYNGDKMANKLDIAQYFWALHADLGFIFNLNKTAGLYLGTYCFYSPANINPKADATTDMHTAVSSFASDRVGNVHPFEVGLKIGLRFGLGKDVDWKEIAAAEAAAAAQA